MTQFEIELSELQRNSELPYSCEPMSAHAPALDRAGIARPVERLEEAISEFDQTPHDSGLKPALSPQAIIEILMKNAEILIAAGDHRLAINILRNVLMREPLHAQALRHLGLSLRSDARYDEALKCFKALAKTAMRTEGMMLVAETLYLCERDDMALSCYREVLKSVVSDQRQLFEIYKNIGNVHVRAGDYESAEEFYNKAYVIHPESDVLMVNYGTLEIQRDNFSDAVNRFRRAVDLNPQNDKGWVGLALVHRQMGDLELSWANVQRALDINSINRTALRLVVDWGVADGKLAIAVTRVQDYLEAEGEDAEMCLTLAKIFTHLGRLMDARTEMERVLALDPAIEGGEALAAALDHELTAYKEKPQV